jgi:AraC family transcriptional regulator of adaptative response/methylated-DNA-[protein]-cysteine methyltransferase
MTMPAVSLEQLSQDYQLVERAIWYLLQNYHNQPGLQEIADSVGMSEYHFQRLFTRWVGISPKRFLQYLTKEHAKDLLNQSSDLLGAAYQTGLSGLGRLHDLFVTCEAVTPGEYKNRGAGLAIEYGFYPSPYGDCLVATTDRGICSLAFIEAGDRSKAVSEIQAQWNHATLVENPHSAKQYIYQIFSLLNIRGTNPIPVYLSGTNFQIKVWEALLRIPSGQVVSYEELAMTVGAPRASRAVGNAVANNPIPVLIPCHRVIRKAGDFGKYRYGTPRKMAMLGWEMAHQ